MSSIPPGLSGPLRAALRGERAEWPELTAEDVRALTDHGVAPWVYSISHNPELRAEAVRAAALESLRTSDLTEVLAALAAAGADALLMKGTPLAHQIYPAPEQRPRGDTDALIRHEDLPLVRKAMKALGFDERVTSGDEHGLRQTTFTRTDAFRLEHAYDVHWAIANTPLFASVLRFEAVRQRAVPVPALGPHARALDLVDALLLACIHRVAHHHDSERLIWLADIALIRDRMSDDQHARFWRAAADARVVAVCARSIELADDWMSRVSANGADRWLAKEERTRYEPSMAYLDREITEGEKLLADLKALPPGARLQRLVHLAFPSREFMRESFGARPVTLPWWYLYRGARGVWRLLSRVGSR